VNAINISEWQNPLSDEDWNALVELGIIQNYASGRIIFLQDEKDEYLALITDGVIKSVSYLPDGKEKTFYFAKGPALAGESSFFDRQGSISTIVTVTNVTCVMVPRGAALKYMYQHPDVIYQVAASLAKKTRNTQIQAEEVYVPVKKRLAHLLLDRYYCEEGDCQSPNNLRLTHAEIASLLGTTRQRITQYISEFTKIGFIECENGMILVKDYAGLDEVYRS